MGELPTPTERDRWERDGFVILPGFASADVLEGMQKRIVEMVPETCCCSTVS